MRARHAVAGFAAALLLAAPAATAAPPARGQNDPSAALTAANEVLDARERALAARDAAAWMATVDPQAAQPFKDAQARHFSGLQSVPLEGFALTARLDDTGDLAPQGDRFLPETRMTYRLRGYDDRDAIDTLWLTFVLREGRWYVTSDSDVADLGLDSARGLWDFGDVATVTTEHFLVLHHPAQASRARSLGELAEEALGRLKPAWDHPWSERLPIVLPGSVDELEQLLQSTIDLDKFVAFVSYATVRDETWTATAPRMYIQDDNLSAYGRGFQVETLVHELVHAAAAPVAGPFISAWVHEGVADWIATGRSPSEKKPSGSDGVLPRDYEFSTGTQSAIIETYGESRSAISYLSGHSGIGAPTAFFAEAGKLKAAPGAPDFRVSGALDTTTDLTLTELEQGWASR